MKNSILGYEQWAQQQRAWVREQLRTREVTNIEHLNYGAKAAFESLSR